MASIKEDKLLWHILTIIGIRISGYCLKPHENFLSLSFKLLSLFFMLHWFLAAVYNVLRHTLIAGCVYFLMPIQIILLWYFLNAEKETTLRITQKLYTYRNKYMLENKKGYFFYVIIITMILFPVIITLVSIILNKNEDIDFLIFGYKIHGHIFVQILRFYANLIYYSCSTFIAFFTFYLSFIFYRWGEVLKVYNNILKGYLKKNNINQNTDFLKDYFEIVKLLQKLSKVLAYPSFIVIFYSLEMILILLYDVLVRKILTAQSLQSYYIRRGIYNGISGFLMLVIYSLSSSMIPEQMAEIQNTAKCYLNKYTNYLILPREVIFYLKRIEKQSLVYISACGMFTLTRQFILTAIGATLTYDLLIINFE